MPAGTGEIPADRDAFSQFMQEPFVELGRRGRGLAQGGGRTKPMPGRFSAGGADAGRMVVISSIDNLVKGAAGQAVQNLNLAPLPRRADSTLEGAQP